MFAESIEEAAAASPNASNAVAPNVAASNTVTTPNHNTSSATQSLQQWRISTISQLNQAGIMVRSHYWTTQKFKPSADDRTMAAICYRQR